MRRKGRRAPVAAAALWIVAAGCGQKGPPLAPLHLVPAAVADVSLRRVEDHAVLRFVLPTSNANGPGPVELDRVEIFAMTIPPGAPAPANRDLLTKQYLVGEVPVRPSGADAPPKAEGDPRPAPGEPATFDEVLTSVQLTPVPVKPDAVPLKPDTVPAKPDGGPVKSDAVPAPPSAPAGATPPGTSPPASAETGAPGQPPGTTEAQPAEGPPSAATAEAPPLPAATAAAGSAPAVGAQSPAAAAGGQQPAETTGPVSVGAPGAPPAGAPAAAAAPAPVSKDPLRIYVARGVTRGGRPGAPSARVQMPLRPLPTPPSAPTADLTETAVVVAWTPPAGEEVPPPAFNVYDGDGTTALNPAPLAAATFEHTAARVGEEHCYSVRSVRVEGPVAIEGPPSERACITPADIFPPATPTGLAAVPTPGQISLIWNPNTEPDLAGYLILRGEAPDGPLQPLITSPIRETSFRDTTVRPDVRYVYAIIAVDTANPPNTSAMSERAEETAR